MLARPWKFWRTALEPAEGRQKNGWSACLLQENWCWHGQGICSAQEMRAGRPGPASSTAKRWECEEGGEDRHVNPVDTGWSRCWHHTMRDCAALRLAAPGTAEAAEALQRAQHVWCTSMLDKAWSMDHVHSNSDDQYGAPTSSHLCTGSRCHSWPGPLHGAPAPHASAPMCARQRRWWNPVPEPGSACQLQPAAMQGCR